MIYLRTYAGLLNTEELCLVNKGFNKSTLRQPSSRIRTKKGYLPPCPSVSAVKSSNIGGEKQNESDQCSFKENLTDVKGQQSCVKFGAANSHVQSKSVKPRRQSFVLKSLDWDSALFTCEGNSSFKLCNTRLFFEI